MSGKISKTKKIKPRTANRKIKTKRPQNFLFGFDFIKSLKKVIIPFNVLALIAGMNFTGLWAVGTTVAYLGDMEISSGNEFAAGHLDFNLSQHSFESLISLDETVSKSAVLMNVGDMDFQYTLRAEEVLNENDFCGALNLQAKLNGVEQYNGDLLSLATPALIVLGTWKFKIELPVDETDFANGEQCRFDVVFEGWQTNVASYDDGGFSDEERFNFTITAGKMVVLNEFLPRPDGIAYGFDFGSDSSNMPQGEWVELYNNSDQSVDLAGWYLRDSTDGDGNKTVITSLNTAPAGDTIAGNSWLAVYMNKAIYNNNGDTVRLFNSDSVLVDSHSYSVSDFCEIEPSPGDENSTDAAGGDCPDVPPNKSYARIPDGIGDWVDPIPTPGGMNVLEDAQDNSVSAGNTNNVSFEKINAEPAVEEEVIVGSKDSGFEETSDETPDKTTEETVEETGVENEDEQTEESTEENVVETEDVQDQTESEDIVSEEIGEETIDNEEENPAKKKPAVEEQDTEETSNDSGDSDNNENESI